MIHKKQKSNDFVVDRVCLLADEGIVFNDHDNEENVHWLYVIEGNANVEIFDNYQNFQVTSDDLIDLHPHKNTFFKCTARIDGCTLILITSPLSNTANCRCEKLTVDNKILQLTTDSKKTLIPLVTDLEIKKHTSNSYKLIPSIAAASLAELSEYDIRTDFNNLSSHALIFNKIV